LHNLVANALAFARHDVAPVVKVVASQDATVDQIHVCDNGIGIAEEHQSAIFDVFSRLNNRRQHDGTGLGLAICQRIADLHQGRLSVESQPGEGSRFTLHLPVVGDRN
jgi:signal transduction histidine kinase